MSQYDATGPRKPEYELICPNHEPLIAAMNWSSGEVRILRSTIAAEALKQNKAKAIVNMMNELIFEVLLEDCAALDTLSRYGCY